MKNFELAHDIALELISGGWVDNEGDIIGELTEVIEKELDSHNVVVANGFDGTWG